MRVRQRQLLADLGREALRLRDLDPLFGAACRIVAAGMDTHLCKILEYIPARGKLLVRAGIGWRDGVVGHVELDAGAASPAGHALETGQPVISNDLAGEKRFATPSLLLEHGVDRAMNVIIRGDGMVFGVLEADSRRSGSFEPDDAVFMQIAADMIGLAIERQRREVDLKDAIRNRELLLREADHRIKNGLQMVTSLLSLQRSRMTNDDVIAALDGAISRVGAVAEAHRALHQSSDLRTVAFDQMLRDLCRHVGNLSPGAILHCVAEGALSVDAERAIPLGLMVNELLTNALRHAYPGRGDGVVEARAMESGGILTVRIADFGVGMSAPPDRSRGLGSSIVQALARQAGVTMAIDTALGKGTSVSLSIDLRGSAEPEKNLSDRAHPSDS